MEKKRGPHMCYLAFCAGWTFVGYAHNPHKTLRRYNREIASGKRDTVPGTREWFIVTTAGPFVSHAAALKFRDLWKHGGCSLRGRLKAKDSILQRYIRVNGILNEIN